MEKSLIFMVFAVYGNYDGSCDSDYVFTARWKRVKYDRKSKRNYCCDIDIGCGIYIEYFEYRGACSEERESE